MSYEDMPTRAECDAEEFQAQADKLQAVLDLINQELVPWASNWNEKDAMDMISWNMDDEQRDINLAVTSSFGDVSYYLDKIIGIATQAEDLL